MAFQQGIVARQDQQEQMLTLATQQTHELHLIHREQGERMDRMFSMIEGVTSILPKIEQHLSEERTKIADSIKKRHIVFIHSRRHGMCPCCENQRILDEHGKRIPYHAEFDHFWLRKQSGFDEVWIVCKKCNTRLRNKGKGGFWRSKVMTFLAYTESIETFESKQLVLGLTY